MGWRPALQKVLWPLKVLSLVLIRSFDCRIALADPVKLIAAARLSEGKIISLILMVPRCCIFRSCSVSLRSLAGLKSDDGKVALSRARLSDPRGCCRRSCRRSQDAEDAEERGGWAGGDNEIEMAKADHRIGWLNRGWRRSRSRTTRTRGLIRTATALSANAFARASLALRN